MKIVVIGDSAAKGMEPTAPAFPDGYQATHRIRKYFLFRDEHWVRAIRINAHPNHRIVKDALDGAHAVVAFGYRARMALGKYVPGIDPSKPWLRIRVGSGIYVLCMPHPSLWIFNSPSSAFSLRAKAELSILFDELSMIGGDLGAEDEKASLRHRLAVKQPARGTLDWLAIHP